MTGTRFNEEQITRGLMAVVVSAGSYSEASKMLAADEDNPLVVKYATLRDWCLRRFPDRYADMRERYAAQLEGKLIHDMRDLAAQGVEIQRLALDKTFSKLMSNQDEDPSRTAANVSRVVQTNLDKMLAVSGRPTSIRQDRSVEEIVRGLVAMKVLELPAEAVVEETPLEIGAVS